MKSTEVVKKRRVELKTGPKKPLGKIIHREAWGLEGILAWAEILADCGATIISFTSYIEVSTGKQWHIFAYRNDVDPVTVDHVYEQRCEADGIRPGDR